MRPVAATLIPLLTCRSFWIWHILGGVVCTYAYIYAWLLAEPHCGARVLAVIIPAWSAYIFTSLQRDILASPASFCLPGHRGVLRRTSLLIGIITRPRSPR